MVIGVTGISGSGKSICAEKIGNLRKVNVIDADKVAKDMQKPRRELL